jgi:hypothetical protein
MVQNQVGKVLRALKNPLVDVALFIPELMD